MSRQPPESCGHGSVSQVATDSASAIEIFDPDEDMVEADQDPVYYEIDDSRFYEACVRDKPRRELPSLLVAQPNQPVSPQSDLKGPSASSRSSPSPCPETKNADITDINNKNNNEETWDRELEAAREAGAD